VADTDAGQGSRSRKRTLAAHSYSNDSNGRNGRNLRRSRSFIEGLKRVVYGSSTRGKVWPNSVRRRTSEFGHLQAVAANK
jgi:hypothetical protein